MSSPTIDRDDHPTRCECPGLAQKPHIEPKGAIIWCNNCGKIIDIPIPLKIIITASVT